MNVRRLEENVKMDNTDYSLVWRRNGACDVPGCTQQAQFLAYTEGWKKYANGRYIWPFPGLQHWYCNKHSQYPTRPVTNTAASMSDTEWNVWWREVLPAKQVLRVWKLHRHADTECIFFADFDWKGKEDPPYVPVIWKERMLSTGAKSVFGLNLVKTRINTGRMPYPDFGENSEK